MLRRLLFSLTLAVFFSFIALGNLSRMIPSAFSSDSVVALELLIYFLSFINLIFLKISLKTLLRASFLSVCILASFFYGCSLHGFDLRAGLYAIRLICILFSILSLGTLCFTYFKASVEQFFSFLFKAYSLAAILGFILYFVFPEASNLWAALQKMHVNFQGDPHVGRFVSVYLDPNYGASLAGFAFCLALYLYSVTRKGIYQLGAFIFMLSGLLSFSRSGIFVLMTLLVALSVPFFLKGIFTRRGLFLSATSLPCLALIAIFYREDLLVFFERTLHFFEEDSALCRLNTFQLGAELVKENPLFGTGINFLYRYTEEAFGLSSLDSSFLAFLAQIGILPFILLTGWSFFAFCYFRKLHRVWMKKEGKAPYFLSLFGVYLAVCCFFASQFNNLLFYPFWILPVGVVAFFLLKSTLVGFTDEPCNILPNANECLRKGN